MSEQLRYIVLSPIPECLCLATACRAEWDDLVISGRSHILDALGKIGQNSPGRVIVLQDRVNQPQQVRECLLQLTRSGVRQILWFAQHPGARSLEEACSGIPGVELILAATLAAAVRKKFDTGVFGELLRSAESLELERKRNKAASSSPEVSFSSSEASDHDLKDFLRYKISLCFMGLMRPEPLKDAVDVLGTVCQGRPFRFSNLPPSDRASVEHFRDADFPYLEGQTPPIMTLKERIAKVAATDLSVMILGETGTGKECVAFYLHELSARRARPFVPLNCAGLEENLLRSELFGHCRGAFTGAIADKKGLVEAAEGGTLFLDEIGDMSLSIQADLLRFLQTRRFRPVGGTEEKRANIRIVAATQPDRVGSGEHSEFRSDLYYRIAEVTLKTPSLREVPEDIRRVIRYMVYERNLSDSQCEKALAYFEKGREVFKRYSWPGNARELYNLVKRYLRLNDDVIQEVCELAETESPQPERKMALGLPGEADSLNSIRPIDNLVADYVRQVNDYYRSGQSPQKLSQRDLADKLGISVNTFKKYLDEKETERAGR
ncbi:MAG TPA: sigma 54-interacting transcriptional regulator [Candidatus Sumerlaeota bacterium]|nr:sigma 54-interacting transcriptional regulator [Candidatus Sumerlaeota bacterium]HPS02986.1 sigma 54-interacting transcriptional regulator [Candidatus Sumerlaeota bacterium]